MCDCSNPSLASGKSERREPSVGDWAAGESLEADSEGNLVAAADRADRMAVFGSLAQRGNSAGGICLSGAVRPLRLDISATLQLTLQNSVVHLLPSRPIHQECSMPRLCLYTNRRLAEFGKTGRKSEDDLHRVPPNSRKRCRRSSSDESRQDLTERNLLAAHQRIASTRRDRATFYADSSVCAGWYPARCRVSLRHPEPETAARNSRVPAVKHPCGDRGGRRLRW